MKYVRLKEGKIVELPFSEKEYNEKYPDSVINYERWYNTVVQGFNVVNTADTIEELCDMFVIVLGNNKRIVTEKANFQWYFARNYQIVEIYGLIITHDKPVYVARMNKRKELELI